MATRLLPTSSCSFLNVLQIVNAQWPGPKRISSCVPVNIVLDGWLSLCWKTRFALMVHRHVAINTHICTHCYLQCHQCTHTSHASPTFHTQHNHITHAHATHKSLVHATEFTQITNLYWKDFLHLKKKVNSSSFQSLYSIVVWHIFATAFPIWWDLSPCICQWGIPLPRPVLLLVQSSCPDVGPQPQSFTYVVSLKS